MDNIPSMNPPKLSCFFYSVNIHERSNIGECIKFLIGCFPQLTDMVIKAYLCSVVICRRTYTLLGTMDKPKVAFLQLIMRWHLSLKLLLILLFTLF